MMRALTLTTAVLCGLLVSACYQHDEVVVPTPEPVAQPGDGPLLDRVPGEQGPVVFNHAGHMGYGFACNDCHHTGNVAAGCVSCHPVPGDDDPAHGGPDDNLVLVGDTQDTAELPGVRFNHYTHGSSHGYKLACTSCHHMGGNMACDTCHGEVAKQQGEAVVPKLKRAMHLQCQGCHESLVGSNPASIAPVACDDCHSDQGPERLEGALSFERAAHLACVECHRDVQDEHPAAPVTCAGCHVDAAAVQAEAAPVDDEVPCGMEDCVPPPAEDGEALPEGSEPTDGEADAAPAEAAPAEAAPAEAAPAAGGQPDVVWAGSMGTVTFHHTTHSALGCASCHPGMAPMTSEKLGMEKGHAACSTCHGADVTGNCAKCHVQ